jgi:hypothetical protein
MPFYIKSDLSSLWIMFTSELSYCILPRNFTLPYYLHWNALATMDDGAVRALMSTVELISTNLDTRPESWREQLQAIRSTTTSLEILDASPDDTRKRWQLPLVSVFQRVAFGDADNGAVQDVADWCLRQALVLLHLYPEDAEILACEFHPF